MRLSLDAPIFSSSRKVSNGEVVQSRRPSGHGEAAGPRRSVQTPNFFAQGAHNRGTLPQHLVVPVPTYIRTRVCGTHDADSPHARRKEPPDAKKCVLALFKGVYRRNRRNTSTTPPEALDTAIQSLRTTCGTRTKTHASARLGTNNTVPC